MKNREFSVIRSTKKAEVPKNLVKVFVSYEFYLDLADNEMFEYDYSPDEVTEVISKRSDDDGVEAGWWAMEMLPYDPDKVDWEIMVKEVKDPYLQPD